MLNLISHSCKHGTVCQFEASNYSKLGDNFSSLHNIYICFGETDDELDLPYRSLTDEREGIT